MGDYAEHGDAEPTGGRRPAVFMFQPNKFEAVPPDRLGEWEYQLANYIGLPAEIDREKLFESGTWSNCGEGRICADDSDYFDAESYGGGDGDPGNAEARLADALAAGRRPTVFMWQPSRFERVKADGLAEWERNIREQVGLPVSSIRRDAGGSETLSATLPNDCMDDSDYEAA